MKQKAVGVKQTLTPSDLTGVFQVRIGKELLTYSKVSEIPTKFDNLIRFEPELPPPPHTPADHEKFAIAHQVFLQLFHRENHG